MFEPPPRMTGHETARMRARLVKEARQWRNRWLWRVSGGWLVGAVLGLLSSRLVAANYGWAVFVGIGFAGGAINCWVQVRLFPMIGSNAEQTFYRVLTVLLAALSVVFPWLLISASNGASP